MLMHETNSMSKFVDYIASLVYLVLIFQTHVNYQNTKTYITVYAEVNIRRYRAIAGPRCRTTSLIRRMYDKSSFLVPCFVEFFESDACVQLPVVYSRLDVPDHRGLLDSILKTKLDFV
jgi:hypothetical protein